MSELLQNLKFVPLNARAVSFGPVDVEHSAVEQRSYGESKWKYSLRVTLHYDAFLTEPVVTGIGREFLQMQTDARQSLARSLYGEFQEKLHLAKHAIWMGEPQKARTLLGEIEKSMFGDE